ncbi:DoxX family protein [Luteimicrobium sp. DT211]|uniref:DoxX family protein n=1 Tax=Luteimicrobium sp. DT211 TaxID=3393412 RepID=UPI003CE98100
MSIRRSRAVTAEAERPHEPTAGDEREQSKPGPRWCGATAGPPRRGSAVPVVERVARRATTGIVIAECAVGGVLYLARQPPFFPTLVRLGYPPYLATMLGTAKLLAAGVLVLRAAGLLPRFLPLEGAPVRASS